MTTVTLPTCDARTGELPGDYGMVPLWCSTGVGLTAYTDIHGVTRRYCRHHGAFVIHRYPALESIDLCHYCGQLDPILAGTYRRFVDPHGDIFTVCDDCVSKADDDEPDEPEYDLNVEGDPTRNGAFG